MTKTKRNKRKHYRKTKRNRNLDELQKMIQTFRDKHQRRHIHVHVIHLQNRDIEPVYNKEPYIEKIIQSLENPYNNETNGLILQNQGNHRFQPIYMTGMNRVYKCGNFIKGGSNKSTIEIFFFPSYLRPNDEDEYDNYLIVNSQTYDDMGEFMKKKMNDVDNLFAYFKKERKTAEDKTNKVKPVAFYKHVVDVFNHDRSQEKKSEINKSR